VPISLPEERFPWKETAMDRRFEVRKREIAAQAEVRPEVFEGMLERLKGFARPFVDLLGRREAKEHGRTYLQGLLSDLAAKNAESIAYLHGQERINIERFVGWSKWDHEPLLDELARQVGGELAEPGAVIVFDPSAHKKSGKHSVGVKRQWCGRLGKVDNCQVGVYMGYASGKGHALVDERLYLPKEWAKNKKRQKKCGVPKDVRYRTRHALALDMLREKGGLLPHGWVAGDVEMGRPSRFRADLRDMGERYLLAVPSNTTVRDLEGVRPEWSGKGARPKRKYEQVTAWREAISEKEWARLDVRDGEKGPIVVECVKRRVTARTDKRRVGPEELLFVTRVKEDDGSWRHDYHLSNAPADTSLSELARADDAEHRIEECLQRAKSEAGLSDYEVRRWEGWHHHQTLSLTATWFLTLEARRGKKRGAGNDGAAGEGGARVAAA
jgi:SRSO17 transposase